MINKNKIIGIVEEYFEDSDKFLIDVNITPQNKVTVIIDRDTGVTVTDIAKLSRYIETFFDREREDFELEVSSAGVGKPLKVYRQYRNNVGRKINIKTIENEKIDGKLLNTDNRGVEIELSEGKDKTGKNKSAKQENKRRHILFDQIKEAKIKPEF